MKFFLILALSLVSQFSFANEKKVTLLNCSSSEDTSGKIDIVITSSKSKVTGITLIAKEGKKQDSIIFASSGIRQNSNYAFFSFEQTEFVLDKKLEVVTFNLDGSDYSCK